MGSLKTNDQTQYRLETQKQVEKAQTSAKLRLGPDFEDDPMALSLSDVIGVDPRKSQKLNWVMQALKSKPRWGQVATCRTH